MKFKLKTSAEYKFGRKNVLLHAGETQFDENGKTTVDLASEVQLNELLEGVPDLSLDEEAGESKELLPEGGNEKKPDPLPPVDSPAPLAPQVLAPELGKAAEESNTIGSEEINDLSKSFDGKSLEELQALVADFPEAEWKGLDEAGLKSYLIAQLSAD